MRVFVTGATGFVGGYVLAALTREQHEVVVLMRRPAALEQLRTRVYRRAGAYEASKLEGALKVGTLAARDGLDYVEVQPGTVAGHSLSGELAAGQSLRGLIDNLVAGRLARVPGMPQLMRTAPESLHFIQTARFDTSVLEGFVRSQNLPWPDMQDVIRRTAEYWLRTPPSCA